MVQLIAQDYKSNIILKELNIAYRLQKANNLPLDHHIAAHCIDVKRTYIPLDESQILFF